MYLIVINYRSVCLQQWIDIRTRQGNSLTCPLCYEKFYRNECESGVTKEQYAGNNKYLFSTNVRDRIASSYAPNPAVYERLLNRGMNLEDMYATLNIGNNIYANLSLDAKNTSIFSKPMEDIEMSINSVEDYFMENDKRFKQLATTVRIGAEKFQEY